jgi:hypothetical protein
MKRYDGLTLFLCILVLASCGQPAPATDPLQEEPTQEVNREEVALEAQALNTQSPLGTNLSGISPFSNDYPFMDAFKASREWTAYQGSSVVATDANGWVKSVKPGQGLFTQVFNAVNGAYPAGDYILLYEGEGDLGVGDDAAPVGTATRTGNTTRQVIRVTPKKDNPVTSDGEDKGISLGLTQTNPNNYVRNIRLIMPGGSCSSNVFRYARNASGCPTGDYVSFEKSYQTLVFHPIYLNTLSKYSTIRFMTWQETNGSTQTVWSGRPKLTDANWSGKKGVPLEIMIALANRLDVDAWVNMPHAADNTYVTEFAKLTKVKLEPGRKVYLEYSNEVWLDRPEPSDDDAQHEYAIAKGKQLGLVSAGECSSVGVAKCTDLNWQRFQSKRSIEIFNIWEQHFGLSRLERVTAGTTLFGVGATQEVLRYQNAHTKTDAFALAPYFGDLIFDEQGEAFIKTFTVGGYIARLRGQLLNDQRSDLRAQKAAIAGVSKRIPLIAYEGGQILVQERGEGERDAQVDRFFDAINRDPRMKQVYLDYLNMWKAEGGQLYNHFVSSGNWTTFGRWGALEYLTQPRSQAPKFDALQTFIERTPRWW